MSLFPAPLDQDYNLLRSFFEDGDIACLKWVARLLGGSARAMEIDKARARLTLHLLRLGAKGDLTEAEFRAMAMVAFVTVPFNRVLALYVKKLSPDPKCPKGVLWITPSDLKKLETLPNWADRQQEATIDDAYLRVATLLPDFEPFLEPLAPEWLVQETGIKEG